MAASILVFLCGQAGGVCFFLCAVIITDKGIVVVDGDW